MDRTTPYNLAPRSTEGSPITLDTFLERSISYERQWPTPLDAQLRRHVLIGLASTVAAVPLSLLLLALLTPAAQSGFFFFGRGVTLGILELLLSPVGVISIAVAILGHAALWYMSDSLQSATWRWHQIAFSLAVAGAVYLSLLGVPVLLATLNLAAWVIVGLVQFLIALVRFLVQLFIILVCIVVFLGWVFGGAAAAVTRR